MHLLSNWQHNIIKDWLHRAQMHTFHGSEILTAATAIEAITPKWIKRTHFLLQWAARTWWPTCMTSIVGISPLSMYPTKFIKRAQHRVYTCNTPGIRSTLYSKHLCFCCHSCFIPYNNEGLVNCTSAHCTPGLDISCAWSTQFSGQRFWSCQFAATHKCLEDDC